MPKNKEFVFDIASKSKLKKYRQKIVKNRHTMKRAQDFKKNENWLCF